MKKSRFNYGENSQKNTRRFGNDSSNQNDNKFPTNKSRRFGNNSSKQNQQNNNKSDENKMSAEDKFMLINESLTALKKVFESGFNYAKEKEITKRAKIDQGVKIKAIDSDLEKTLSAGRIEIEKIQSDFKLNYKELENENEKNKQNTMITLKVLDLVDSFIKRIDKNEVELGVEHPIVIDLSNKLHEQSISLTNLLKPNN